MKSKCIIIGFLLSFSFFTPLLYAEEIQVSVMFEPKQRRAFSIVFQDFFNETGIKIRTIPRTDAAYKRDLSVWLLEGKQTPDVLYWQASQRLFFYAKKGVLHPITQLWNENNFDQYFSHVKSGVTYNDEVYAVPTSYYHWGIFYKKSLIERFGGVQHTWESFIDQCKQLKDAGVTPIGIGTKEGWPAAAWFDYIDLRTNGLEFHQQLLAGSISFHDQRVQNILVEWKRLIDQGFFNENSKKYTWHALLPEFYRNRIAFFLIGNFATSKWPQLIVEDIGFMPFPKMKDIPLYEDAPMDVFMIPKNTKKLKEAEMFLKFMARADVQSQLNKELGFLPPNKDGVVGEDPFIQAGAKLLQKAKGVSQFFDRDTIPEFDKKAVPILAEFLNSGDLENASNRLEKARIEVFGVE